MFFLYVFSNRPFTLWSHCFRRKISYNDWNEVKAGQQKETELDSKDRAITGTIKLVGEEIFSLFQGVLKSFDSPKGPKVELEALSKIVSFLTNKKFGKTEKK